MEQSNLWNNKGIIEILNNNKVVVMPTDTLYGILGKAFYTSVVNRIYVIRKRSPEKPCIILIGNLGELIKFSINLSKEQEKEIRKYTEPTSFVLDCPDEKFTYLHRGTQTLAFRLPTQKDLQDLLKQTGPLIAPSANPEGLSPAKNITEAQKYFGNAVDLYIDGGEIQGKASKIIKLNKDGSVEILRN